MSYCIRLVIKYFNNQDIIFYISQRAYNILNLLIHLKIHTFICFNIFLNNNNKTTVARGYEDH